MQNIQNEMSSSLLSAPAVIMAFVMPALNPAKTTALYVHSIRSRTKKNSGLSSDSPGISDSLLRRCHSLHTSIFSTLVQTRLALELVGEKLVMRRELQVSSCFIPELSVRGLVISAFYRWSALLSLSPV